MHVKFSDRAETQTSPRAEAGPFILTMAVVKESSFPVPSVHAFLLTFAHTLTLTNVNSSFVQNKSRIDL